MHFCLEYVARFLLSRTSTDSRASLGSSSASVRWDEQGLETVKEQRKKEREVRLQQASSNVRGQRRSVYSVFFLILYLFSHCSFVYSFLCSDLCQVVPSQLYKHKVPEHLMAKVVDVAKIKPQDRFRKITQSVC